MGRPVLLLHGIPGSGGGWSSVVDELDGAFRVVVPDLLGFGESSRTDDFERLWIEGQADALLALLDDLDLNDVLLIAHDYGGPVASALIAKAPGRFAGLLLAASNTFHDTPIPFPLSGIFLPVLGRAWAAVLFSAPSLRLMVS